MKKVKIEALFDAISQISIKNKELKHYFHRIQIQVVKHVFWKEEPSTDNGKGFQILQ